MPSFWSASAWQFGPPFFLAVLFVALYRAGGVQRVSTRRPAGADRWRPIAFYSAVGVVLFALDSPLDVWSESSFAAHMTQHVLLLVVAPPLVVFSAPWNRLWRPLPLGFRRAVARTVALSPRARPLRLLGHALMRPEIAAGIFALDLVAWHVPVLFEATLHFGAVHDLEHALFLATGILLWVQLIDSPPLRSGSSELLRAAIATVAMLSGWVVAVVLAFAPDPLYSSYAHLVERPWGLSALGDQGIAAGVMWVPGSLPFTVAIIVYLYRWLEPEPATPLTREVIG